MVPSVQLRVAFGVIGSCPVRPYSIMVPPEYVGHWLALASRSAGETESGVGCPFAP